MNQMITNEKEPSDKEQGCTRKAERNKKEAKSEKIGIYNRKVG